MVTYVDSSKASVNVVPLHIGNIKAFILVAHATSISNNETTAGRWLAELKEIKGGSDNRITIPMLLRTAKMKPSLLLLVDL